MVIILRPGNRTCIIDGATHELSCAPSATHTPYELLRLLGLGLHFDAHSMTVEVRTDGENGRRAASACATCACDTEGGGEVSVHERDCR